MCVRNGGRVWDNRIEPNMMNYRSNTHHEMVARRWWHRQEEYFMMSVGSEGRHDNDDPQGLLIAGGCPWKIKQTSQWWGWGRERIGEEIGMVVRNRLLRVLIDWLIYGIWHQFLDYRHCCGVFKSLYLTRATLCSGCFSPKHNDNTIYCIVAKLRD